MKKLFTAIISIVLFAMFLIYSGVYIDRTDPLAIARTYFNYLKTGEYFLTYQIHKRALFDQERIYKDNLKYNIPSMVCSDLTLLELQDNYALILARIQFKNNKFIYCKVKLEKNEKEWLVTNAQFDKVLSGEF